jgi:hypothetical protein
MNALTIHDLQVGCHVLHGSPGYENEEVIAEVVDLEHYFEIVFESGYFTHVPKTLKLDEEGTGCYWRYPFNKARKFGNAYESICIKQ